MSARRKVAMLAPSSRTIIAASPSGTGNMRDVRITEPKERTIDDVRAPRRRARDKPAASVLCCNATARGTAKQGY
jgi:hypothetical protein